MDRRSRFAFVLATASFLALGVATSVAHAGPKDAAAQKIDTNAMNNDFLMADFPKAAQHLKKAVDTCGASGCDPAVKARILVHLGIVLVNKGDKGEAEKVFIEALKLDKSVAPEKDFTTPEIAEVFKNAKSKAKSAGGASTTEPSAGGDESSTETVGEISHMSVPEQMVNTPVPIWVAVPKDLPVGRVLLRYKPFGGVWKKLNLRRKRGGWGGNIPCTDVTTTGKLKYYINILDKSGDPLTSLGSLTKPYVVQIKNQLDGDPPHLPHEPPPARCQAKEDCPPGLPGCSAGSSEEGGGGTWGATCEDDSDCGSGFVCNEGMCEEGEGGGEEETKHSPYAKHWIGAFAALDVAWLSGKDVCGRETQLDNANGFQCFFHEGDYKGEQYWGQPDDTQFNAISGGFAPATKRLMLGYEYAVMPNLTLGIRAGWAFGGGPDPVIGTKFSPFHAEVHGAFWLGKDPLSRVGIRPFVSLSGGFGQFDSMVVVKVQQRECSTEEYDDDNVIKGEPVNYDGTDYCHYTAGDKVDQDVPMNEEQQMDVWYRAGKYFAGVGGGAVYAFDKNQGILGELRIGYTFPVSTVVVTPVIGYVHGF